MLGIISSRPCDEVKVVVSAPPCSDAVHRARRAAFALHLDHVGNRTPDVRLVPAADH